jgi:hypothetical protein
MSPKIYRNEDVKRIVAFVPPGHMHVRIYIEFTDQSIIPQEATVSAIIRAFVNVSHHPIRRAYELVNVKLEDRKYGYAEYQLIETPRSDEEVLRDVMELYEADTRDA